MSIRIREMNRKGSETATIDVLEQAQAVVTAAQERGVLVVDETAEDVALLPGEAIQDEHSYVLVPAIAGG